MVDLVRELQDLGAAIDWPDDDVASRVGKRLRATESGTVTTIRGGRSRRARGWRIAVATAAAVAVAVLAIPSSRATVGDWLGVGGTRIQVSPTTTTALQQSPDLQLGPEVALADLRAEVGFNMPVPRLAGFEHPDEVHVARPPAGGEATLVYRARPDLPAAGPSGIGMLISAFRADIDPGYFNKTVGPESRVEPVTVQGLNGYWIEGAPHEFLYRDGAGNVVPESVRLAGNVLLWEMRGVTVRIESALPRDDVIRIADAMV